MDSLKELFAKKEYELILSLTNKSHDALSLYYRLESFFHLEQFEKAIALIKKENNHFKEYTFEMMQIHFASLIKLKLYEEAYQIVKHYENFPYISQEVEEYLSSAPQMIRNYELKNRPKPLLSDEQLETMLLHPKDENDLIIALENIRQRKVSNFFKPLRKLIVGNVASNFIKTFALMLLIENKDGKEITFTKNEKTFSLIPKDINLLDYNLLEEDLFDDIETLTKNTTIRDVSRQLFDQLFFLLFPDVVANIDETNLLTGSLIVLAGEYLKTQINLDDIILKLQLNKNELEEYVSKYRLLIVNSFD
ncbi:MAG: hypothetical protein WCZ47_00670 [Bacilli bacterium]|jgi:hypothetical protein|nr:hypothetical protein [Bacilli bacterium]